MYSKKTKVTLDLSNETRFTTKRNLRCKKTPIPQNRLIKNKIDFIDNIQTLVIPQPTIADVLNTNVIEIEDQSNHVLNYNQNDMNNAMINDLSFELDRVNLNEKINNDKKENIFEGSNISINEASLLILSFIQKYNLSENAQNDLIKLIKCLLPSSNKVPKTINKMYKTFSKKKTVLIEKYFCKICQNELESGKNCPKCNIVQKTYDIFLSINFKNQLENLVNEFSEEIETYTTSERHYIDIIDGDFYKKKSEPNILNILVYTDGIQIAKSIIKQFWPVIIGICELPLKIRDSIKNKLVIGVWHGKLKPKSDILFQFLKDEIEKINENGIFIKKDGKNTSYKIQVYGIICDSPAKSLVMNTTHFNGYFGCPYCLNPGSYNHLYRKMTFSQKDFELRTKESFENYSMEGTDKIPRYGVKGNVIISSLIDFTNGLPLDYMHLLCLGIFKRILNLWFDSSNHQFEFYIGKPKTKRKIQNELKKFKFPHTLSRIDFEIENYNTWKATEIRTFFLYICIPLLKNILKPKYFWNIACLIFAVKMLHQLRDRVDLRKAEDLIKVFSKWFITYYGEDNLTFTFHCISKHLVDDVKLHGSLISHSMFSAESSLGYFRRSLNGTRGLSAQYIRHSIERSIVTNEVKQIEMNSDNSHVKDIFNYFSKSNFFHEKTRLLEPFNTRNLNNFEAKEFNIAENGYNLSVKISHRLYHDSTIFHSISYRKLGEKKGSYFVSYLEKNTDELMFGQIDYFLEVEG
ncbi:unnamed protein product, partial [Brachionus calyciflorus]